MNNSKHLVSWILITFIPRIISKFYRNGIEKYLINFIFSVWESFNTTISLALWLDNNLRKFTALEHKLKTDFSRSRTVLGQLTEIIDRSHSLSRVAIRMLIAQPLLKCLKLYQLADTQSYIIISLFLKCDCFFLCRNDYEWGWEACLYDTSPTGL